MGEEQNPAPLYYRNRFLMGTPSDVYDMHLAFFGPENVMTHLILEGIQYFVRAQEKGNFLEDIKKIQIICERLLLLHTKYKPGKSQG